LLVLLGLLLGAARARERSHMRRRADTWIVRGHHDVRAWYGWRIIELTAPQERRQLARSLRSVTADLAPGRLPGAIPLNRSALRPYTYLVQLLAQRLEAVERPVSPAGILGVHTLLTSPGSVLYARPLDGDATVDVPTGLKAALGDSR
jgi:hypothetical protein